MKITRIAIIDVSASMREPFSAPARDRFIARRTGRSQKFRAALDHLRFAIQKMPPDSELIIIAFAESAEVVYHGSASDTSGIDGSISRLRPTGRSTNLAAAFDLVLQLLESGQHRIRPLDVVTDGLSNQGDPIPPARRLQKEHGVYIHLYLIDPSDEGMMTANQVVGDEGEGEVDPVASEAELMGQQRSRLDEEEETIRRMDRVLARQEAARSHFFALAPPEHLRPRITASYPELIAPAQWRTIQLFIYTAEFAAAVEREIQKTREEQNGDYGSLSARFPRGVPKGCPIRVRLSSKELRANPSEVTIQWYEPFNRLAFRIAAADDSSEDRVASMDIEVFADDLLVSSMRLSIAINSDAREVSAAQSTVQWYEDVFASCARENLEVVKHLKERYAALGVYMFIDLDDLRSGAFWRPALLDQIERSDLFQLFWSHAAEKSEYVRTEWQHALRVGEIKGSRFIRPVYWEEPMPMVPEELSHINFRRIEFARDIAASRR